MTYLEKAYKAVTQELTAPVEIPFSLLMEALPMYIAASGSSEAAGRVLYNSLDGIDWDWPAWKSFAKRAGYETLEDIAIFSANMRPAAILKTKTITELKLLSEKRQIRLPSRSTKAEIISALIKGVGRDGAKELVSRFRLMLLDAENRQCRQKMAMHMASRILSVSYNSHRYDQLSDPEFLTIRPFWRFVYVQPPDIYKPQSCRVFDNKILLHSEAQKVFPALPCAYLQCACRIATESSSVRNDQN